MAKKSQATETLPCIYTDGEGECPKGYACEQCVRECKHKPRKGVHDALLELAASHSATGIPAEGIPGAE